jgi:hypothetical protein
MKRNCNMHPRVRHQANAAILSLSVRTHVRLSLQMRLLFAVAKLVSHESFHCQWIVIVDPVAVYEHFCDSAASGKSCQSNDNL